ncbi:uncharacterized protein DUF397 [Actinomadura pelletieri DSM 43383]|uniref:Uncharacterized protein DUF397 n=1 Tax=Actinomadura pelletieri DSM 43383 TaxID=1120940 RepID=A0A495QUE1_9ACTN|nr:DUF397 domain-containing protein [Actinomadura pelletieri]RKS77109.1 uncharacterized protein DUF397 [Actinomadura pelletieri DSM 43383]
MSILWRKSTHSGGADDQHCVELGRLVPGIGVRDSKAPESGHLTLTTSQFANLVKQIKRER